MQQRGCVWMPLSSSDPLGDSLELWISSTRSCRGVWQVLESRSAGDLAPVWTCAEVPRALAFLRGRLELAISSHTLYSSVASAGQPAAATSRHRPPHPTAGDLGAVPATLLPRGTCTPPSAPATETPATRGTVPTPSLGICVRKSRKSKETAEPVARRS